MDAPVAFEWDDAKAAANEAKHGVPFAFAVRVFLDEDRLESEASRPEDRETRLKLVGSIDGMLYTVVFTWRGEIRRIISARRTNKREERAYGDRSLQT